MIWLIKYWRIAVAAITGAAIFAAGWNIGEDSIQRKWDEDVATRTALLLKQTQEAAEKLRKLEETKNANIAEIDRLRANNHALWLRLPKTPCIGSGQTGKDNPAGSGELPEGAPSGAEQALNEFDKRWADEAYRADKVVEDCRVLNDMP